MKMAQALYYFGRDSKKSCLRLFVVVAFLRLAARGLRRRLESAGLVIRFEPNSARRRIRAAPFDREKEIGL